LSTILVLIIIAVILVIIFFLTRAKKEGSGNWIQFYAKGKEAGFTIKDIDQLRQLVSTCGIAEPMSIFKSKKQFEIIIRSMVNKVRLAGDLSDPAVQLFVSKLFDYFKKAEMEAVENKTRISNSRQISEGQVLKILVAGTGVYKSEVIKNTANFLTISRPASSKGSATMQWYGLNISVYFWREDDAGYVFDTEIVDEVFSKGISSLKVQHNDSLFRTQKRKSMRVKFQKAAFLYMIDDNENPHRLETSAGLRCFLEDISDCGCAFRVNGQATVGLRLKVQFLLDRVPICIPATVRSIDYNQEANVSFVHMEADPLPVATRNHILCEVFKMLPDEDDDELPFRVLEEEADNLGQLQEASSGSE